MDDEQPSTVPDITRFAGATAKRKLSVATTDVDEIFKRARQGTPKARTFFWNDHSAWPGLKKKTSAALPALEDGGGSGRDDDQTKLPASALQDLCPSPKTSDKAIESDIEPEPKKISFYLRIDNTLIPMLGSPDPSIPLTAPQLAKVKLALTDVVVKPFHSPEVYAGRPFAPDPFKLARGKADGSTPRRRESAPSLGLDFGQELAGMDMPLRTEECVVRMPVEGYPPARVATPMPARTGLRNKRKPVPPMFPSSASQAPQSTSSQEIAPAPAAISASKQSHTHTRRDSIQPYPSVLFAPPQPSIATPTVIPPTPPAPEPIFFNPQGWRSVPPNVSADLQLWYDIPMAPVQFDCSSFLPYSQQPQFFPSPVPVSVPVPVERRASMPAYPPSSSWTMVRSEKEDLDMGMFFHPSNGILHPQQPEPLYAKQVQPVHGWAPMQPTV